MSDLINRADAIEALCNAQCELDVPHYPQCDQVKYCDEIKALLALPSAEAVPQSEQYKKGFEDAKRAFELEFAREAENIRKRNAQLEVMLNAQKAISAEAEWIPCSERLPKHGDDILVTYSDGEVSIIRGARSKYWMKWEALENSNLILPIAWMPLPKPYREDGENDGED